MLQEKAIFDLLHQYKKLVGKDARCKSPDLYGLNPYELALAAENGDKEALRSVAITLLKGDVIDKDVENATELFYRLCNSPMGYEDLVSQYYYSKILCVREDFSKGLEINEDLVQRKYAPALILRGKMHENGLCNLELSIKKAKEYYLEAYQKKHVQGGLLFATLLFKRGSFRDKLRAILVFVKISFVAIFSKRTRASAECDTL